MSDSTKDDAPGAIPEPDFPASNVDMLYRVYGIKDEMPPLEKLLARLTSGNPYNPQGGFVFPPGQGMRRLQDALGASRDYFVMGYTREEAPGLFEDAMRAVKEQVSHDVTEHDELIVRDARLCVVIRAELTNPPNNAYVETLVHLADAFRDLLHGVVWDVRMERLYGHEEWREKVMADVMSAINHVSVRREPADGGRATLVTRGLRKFGNADIEVCAVPAELEGEVEGMLLDFAEHITQGDLLYPDEEIEYTHGKVRAVAVGEGDAQRLRLADAVEGEETDPAKGAPKLFAGLAEARRQKEGKRAGGGRAADN